MKYLSTFSGIGGFEIGIQNAYRSTKRGEQAYSSGVSEVGSGLLTKTGQDTGSKDGRAGERTTDGTDERPLCIGYSEVDSHAIKTYEEHYDHTNYGDITAIDAESLPDFDLIVGGFPCQAFSVAGKRRGFDETRGTLFFDLARILKHKRPGHFVFENVKGLLSHDGGKTIQTIAGVLSDLGYRIEWQVLNSKDFGVPQNRERIYIVGHLRERCSRQVLPIVQSSSWDNETQGESSSQGQRVWGNDSRVVAATLAVRDYKGGNNLINQLNQPKHSNDRVYGDDGISPTLNTMQGGNRQPFVAVSGKSAIMGLHHDREKSQLDDRTLESQTELRSKDADMLGLQGSKTTNRDTPHERGLARQQDREPTGTLSGLSHTNTPKTSELQSRRLRDDTPKIRLLREAQPEVQEVRQSTNDQAEPTQSDTRIRRLTPTECHRLQGFPDGWCVGSDTQQYKQLGNAVTTNVVEAVMLRLKECLV